MAKFINSYSPKNNKITRPGVHAKSKSSKVKGSKNYVKRYRGQGR